MGKRMNKYRRRGVAVGNIRKQRKLNNLYGRLAELQSEESPLFVDWGTTDEEIEIVKHRIRAIEGVHR